MTPSRPPTTHSAARAEDALDRALARLLQARGWHPRIIPYDGYGAAGWARVLCRVLLAPPLATPARAGDVRGWQHFFSAKLAGVPVTVELGGTEQVVCSGRGGYLDVVVPMTAAVPDRGSWMDVTFSTASAQRVSARVRMVGAGERLGVISDIDDTVLVTALPRPLVASWNTFVRREESRRPVPGMAGLFRDLTARAPDALVVYVSTGAWNLAPALRRFLARRGFPAGPLLLTDWGPTPEGWFRSGRDHKHRTLRRLFDELPQLRWVLVGDDGQHDPTLYDDVVWARPERVRVVAIRQLARTEHVLTHGMPGPLPGQITGQPAGHPADQTDTPPVPWLRAPTGRDLADQLRRRGLLEDGALDP
ncbi:MAG: App1 family protein [Angustibacter sp.]